MALSADAQTALVGAPDAGANDNGAAYFYSEAGGTWPATPSATFTGNSGRDPRLVGGALGRRPGRPGGRPVHQRRERRRLPIQRGRGHLVNGCHLHRQLGRVLWRLGGALGRTTVPPWWAQRLPAPTAPAPPTSTARPAAPGLLPRPPPSAGARPSTSAGSVALSADGQTALVGATWAGIDDAGAAYLYNAPGGSWTANPSPTATFTVSSTVYLGWSVALSADGQTALVGAPDTGSGEGAAYLNSAPGGSWTANPSPIYTFIGSSGEALGASVTLSADGQTALVGATADETGVVYLYSEAGGTWSTAESRHLHRQLGRAARLLGGALGRSPGPTQRPGWSDYNGAAYLYSVLDGAWLASPSPIVTFTGSSTEELGWSVALSADGQTALVGAPYLAGNATSSRPGPLRPR